MPVLVESGFIYIARPPLYSVRRKKEICYIHSEKEMDEHLLKLGISDIRLRYPESLDSLDHSQVEILLRQILEVEALIGSVERKGLPFKEFLKTHRMEDDKWPIYQAMLGDDIRFVYSEEELLGLKQLDHELQERKHHEVLASMPEEEVTDDMRIFKPKRLPVIELIEPVSFFALIEKLKKFGLSLDKYNIAGGQLFDLIEEGEIVTPIYTLKELIGFLRVNGRKGIEIQRYKGLGEMNADQLWDTTMDPLRRTLVKVTMPDAISADHIFSMLMGEEVLPRRNFIEQHALSVKNLDI